MATVACDRPARAELLGDDARRLLRGLRGVQQRRDPGPRDLVLPAVHGSADGERVVRARRAGGRPRAGSGRRRSRRSCDGTGCRSRAGSGRCGARSPGRRRSTPRRAARRASLGRTAGRRHRSCGQMLSRALDVRLVTRLRSLPGGRLAPNGRRGIVRVLAHRRFVSRAALVAMFAALSVGAAACGDSDDDAAGGGDGATAAEETASVDASKCGLGNGREGHGRADQARRDRHEDPGHRLHADHGRGEGLLRLRQRQRRHQRPPDRVHRARRSRPTRSRSPRWRRSLRSTTRCSAFVGNTSLLDCPVNHEVLRGARLLRDRRRRPERVLHRRRTSRR